MSQSGHAFLQKEYVMFVQMRRTVVTEGNAHKIVERFKKNPEKPSKVEQREGYIDREVLVKKHVVVKKK